MEKGKQLREEIDGVATNWRGIGRKKKREANFINILRDTMTRLFVWRQEGDLFVTNNLHKGTPPVETIKLDRPFDVVREERVRNIFLTIDRFILTRDSFTPRWILNWPRFRIENRINLLGGTSWINCLRYWEIILNWRRVWNLRMRLAGIFEKYFVNRIII